MADDPVRWIDLHVIHDVRKAGIYFHRVCPDCGGVPVAARWDDDLILRCVAGHALGPLSRTELEHAREYIREKGS